MEATQKINAILDNEIGALGRLAEIMNKEYELLNKRDVTAVEHLLGEKQTTINQIEKLTSEHGKILAQNPLSSGPVGSMNEYLNMLGHSDDQLSKKWQQVVDRLEECRLLNTRNGNFINISRDFVMQALVTLRGQEHAGDSSSCYDANGKKTPLLNKKTMGKI